eukprot:468684-Pleurochrysis_carterae.AAC.1
MRLVVGAMQSCLLSKVHAGCTGIGDEGWKALAESLKFDQALASINLSRAYCCLHGHTQLPIC